jgi:hypothetical protein
MLLVKVDSLLSIHGKSENTLCKIVISIAPGMLWGGRIIPLFKDALLRELAAHDGQLRNYLRWGPWAARSGQEAIAGQLLVNDRDPSSPRTKQCSEWFTLEINKYLVHQHVAVRCHWAASRR